MNSSIEKPLLFLPESDLARHLKGLTAVTIRKREQDPASSLVGDLFYNAYVNRPKRLHGPGRVLLRKCGAGVKSGGRIVPRQDLFEESARAFDELYSPVRMSSLRSQRERGAEL